MFKNIINFNDFPKTLRNDGALQFIFQLYGNIIYRNKITSFYTNEKNGVYSKMDNIIRTNLIHYVLAVVRGYYFSIDKLAIVDDLLEKIYMKNDVIEFSKTCTPMDFKNGFKVLPEELELIKNIDKS